MYYGYAWILTKARISADTIGQYIGHDKSISAYRLSVKFHRYANPVITATAHGQPSVFVKTEVSFNFIHVVGSMFKTRLSLLSLG